MPQPETIQMDGELTLEIPIPASTRLWMFKSSANPLSRSLLGLACRSSAPYTSPSPSERRFTSCSPDAFPEAAESSANITRGPRRRTLRKTCGWSALLVVDELGGLRGLQR